VAYTVNSMVNVAYTVSTMVNVAYAVRTIYHGIYESHEDVTLPRDSQGNLCLCNMPMVATSLAVKQDLPQFLT
jgi:hypothetical protein